MQHMPDKEFDNLFRDKFKDAEITPSANLWANIEKELEPRKKRVLPIYWMAAASIAIAITAMLVFQKKEVIQLHGTDQTAQVKSALSIDTIAIPKEKIEVAQPQVQKMFTKTEAVNVIKDEKQAVVNDLIENNSKKDQLVLQPNSNNDRLPIKQQDPRPIDVLPNKEIQNENSIVIAHVPTTEKIEDNNTISEAGSTDRKGIRNVGDLVNYVVDKVDKRDKKLVRFNTDDDDNSSIIGINIGFLKFNKKNKEQR